MFRYFELSHVVWLLFQMIYKWNFLYLSLLTYFINNMSETLVEFFTYDHRNIHTLKVNRRIKAYICCNILIIIVQVKRVEFHLNACNNLVIMILYWSRYCWKQCTWQWATHYVIPVAMTRNTNINNANFILSCFERFSKTVLPTIA